MKKRLRKKLGRGEYRWVGSIIVPAKVVTMDWLRGYYNGRIVAPVAGLKSRGTR